MSRYNSAGGLIGGIIRKAVQSYEQTPEGQILKRSSVESHTTRVPGRFYEKRDGVGSNYSQPRAGRRYSKDHSNEAGFFQSNDCSSYYTRDNGGKASGLKDQKPSGEDLAFFYRQNHGIIVRNPWLAGHGWKLERGENKTCPHELTEKVLNIDFRNDLRNMNGGDLDWQSLYDGNGHGSLADSSIEDMLDIDVYEPAGNISEENRKLERIGRRLDKLKAQENRRAERMSPSYDFMLKEEHPCQMFMGDLRRYLREHFGDSFDCERSVSPIQDTLDYDTWDEFYKNAKAYFDKESKLENMHKANDRPDKEHSELLAFL